MPDHVHIFLYVSATLPELLGFYIARFKIAVNNATGIDHLFEDGFNDQIISYKRNLNELFNYIRANPYRLAVRRAIPDFFRRRDNLTIEGTSYQAYGNMQLLNNPFKDQVIVHRADTYDQYAHNRERWLYTAANGGVLVSPFISKREKEIRVEAEESGARFILITHEAFGERFKPAAHDFDLCAKGRMLIITLGLPSMTSLTRQHCQDMNTLAGRIATTGPY